MDVCIVLYVCMYYVMYVCMYVFMYYVMYGCMYYVMYVCMYVSVSRGVPAHALNLPPFLSIWFKHFRDVHHFWFHLLTDEVSFILRVLQAN